MFAPSLKEKTFPGVKGQQCTLETKPWLIKTRGTLPVLHKMKADMESMGEGGNKIAKRQDRKQTGEQAEHKRECQSKLNKDF